MSEIYEQIKSVLAKGAIYPVFPVGEIEHKMKRCDDEQCDLKTICARYKSAKGDLYRIRHGEFEGQHYCNYIIIDR